MTDWSRFTPIEDEQEIDWSQFSPVDEAPPKSTLDRARDAARSGVSVFRDTLETAGRAIRGAAGYADPRQPSPLSQAAPTFDQDRQARALRSLKDELANGVAQYPLEQRIGILRQLAQAGDERAPAAQALLAEQEAMNRDAQQAELSQRGLVDIAAKAPQRAGKPGKTTSKSLVAPEVQDFGLGVSDAQRQELEARAGAARQVGQSATLQALSAPAKQDEAAESYDEPVYATAARRLGDVALSTLKVPTSAVKPLVDLVRMFSADTVGREASKFIERVNQRVDEKKSTGAQLKAIEFQRIMANPNATGATALFFLAENPGFLLEESIPSVGSMAPIVGGAKAASAMASSLKWLRRLPPDKRAAALEAIAVESGLGVNAMVNAADTFTETKGDLADRYMAAGIAGAGSYLAGRATGGGAEGMLLRSGAANKVKEAGLGMLREGAQEGGEAGSQSIGQQLAETGGVDPRQVLKRSATEGLMGSVVGGATGAYTGQSREAALADALQQDIADTQFIRQGIEGFANRAITPGTVLTDARAVDPTIRPVRVEEQPTEVMPAEQVAQMAQQRAANMAAQKAAQQGDQAGVPAAGPGDSQATPSAAPAVQGFSPIGVATVPQGDLATRAAQDLPAVDAQPAAAPRVKLANFDTRGQAITYAAENRLNVRDVVQQPDGRWGMRGLQGIDQAPVATQAEISQRSPDAQQQDAQAVEAFNAGVDFRNTRKTGQAQPESRLTLDADPAPVVRVLQGAAEQLFGLRVVSVDGLKGGDGAAFQMPDGRPVALVRKGAKPEELTVAVAGHEAYHSLAREEPELVARYQEQLQTLLREGVVDRRRQYEGKSATPGGMAYGAEEVAADVSGSMWLREDFWRKVAELDPNLFRGLRYRFMANMAKLLDHLGAAKLFKSGERYNLDKLVTDIAAARDLTARLWADRAMGKGKSKVEQQADAELDRALEQWGAEGGRMSRSERPYGAAPNTLMGYPKSKPAKAFGQSKYRHVEYVRVSWPDGRSMVEAMDGLNKSHALERARRNWTDAEIEPITAEQAEAEDPGIIQAVESSRYKPDDARLSRDEPVRGILAEVAPNPDDTQAVEAWRGLQDSERQMATRATAKRAATLLEREFRVNVRAAPASGTFEGQVNPSFVLEVRGASFDTLKDIARLVGYALEQKAVIPFDESITSGEDLVSFARVTLPRQMDTAQVDSLRRHMIERAGVDGDTLRDGAIFYGNFTGKSDEEFLAQIEGALASFEGDGEADVQMVRFASAYIGDFAPGKYEDYLKGTRYEGEPEALRQDEGRPVLRGEGRGADGLEQQGGPAERQGLRARADEFAADIRRFRGGFFRPVRGVDEGPGDRAPGGLRGANGPVGEVSAEYGKPREGSVSVTGYHYSQARRGTLIAAMHGSGLKGAERERLKGADPRLRQRISVYVANANGVQPEAGVGGYLHGVKLNNLYDVAADPLGLVKQGGSANAWEARIIDAGFDGYFNPKVLPTPQAVLLGPHSVKVDYLGQHARLTPVETRMSRDEDPDWQPDVFYGDVEKISDDDYNLDALKQDELDDELGQPRVGRQELRANPTSVRSAGIMMEAGAPLLDYREDGSGFIAAVQHDGRDYFFKVSPFGFDGDWSAIPDAPRGEFGEALRLNGVTEAAARSYNQRAAASIALHADGYDLLRQVDKKAADRIAKTWEALRGKEGAFEFDDPPPGEGKPGRFTGAAFVARAQQIADTMLAGKKHQFDVSGQGNMLNFAVRGATDSDAQIELDDDGREKRIYLHAINLDRGSGAGKAFYQVAAQVAKDFGAKVMADPQGLTAVNTYRRTEQMLSAHLRGGSTMQPGYGQRVYGWEPGKSKAAERNNLIRLALAAARNAKELAPAADQLRYDPATGKFTVRGEDAEARVKEMLADPDARKLSLSRSTLARAAITFEAMAGEVAVPDGLSSPVLYSRDEPSTPLEELAADDYKALSGRVIRVSGVDEGGQVSVEVDAAELMRGQRSLLNSLKEVIECE